MRALWDGRVLAFDALPSTNTWALEHAGELRHGDVVRAHAQTAGRGRLSRVWLALPGRSLTLSCVLQSPAFVPLGPNLGQVAACAVADTLAGFGLRAELKWPNDVMVADRKLAGMLVEMADTPPTLVLGIGLNVNVTEADLKEGALDRPATSMQAAAGHPFDIEDVFRVLLGHLQAWLDRAVATGLQPVLDRWASADWLSGQEIVAYTAGGLVAGRYGGMDTMGRIRVVRPDGETALWSGDVERVRRSTSERSRKE